MDNKKTVEIKDLKKDDFIEEENVTPAEKKNEQENKKETKN